MDLENGVELNFWEKTHLHQGTLGQRYLGQLGEQS